MSEQPRAQRRRAGRGSSGPPPKRDPMLSIYLGFGIIIVLVFIGFGIARWRSNSARNAAMTYDISTPTPAPGPKRKAIQLQANESIGASVLPTANPQKGLFEDTNAGGTGQPVDGIPCESSEGVVLHIHSDLALFVHGKEVQIPAYIGMAPTPQGGCLYWIHTHDASGVIHIEAGSLSAPDGGPFTLGMFFNIWGQPLSRTQVARFTGPVTAFVNGALYNGKLSAIALRSHQDITLEVGKPIVPPPDYLLPPGD
jgi:hypothetical protein